ncbi:MAG: hypothetical protein KDD64_16085, partial [Bdellovibrionales bacterium]|nr:hypothetical protein [Bdellovibrionales bacterium]
MRELLGQVSAKKDDGLADTLNRLNRAMEDLTLPELPCEEGIGKDGLWQPEITPEESLEKFLDARERAANELDTASRTLNVSKSNACHDL